MRLGLISVSLPSRIFRFLRETGFFLEGRCRMRTYFAKRLFAIVLSLHEKLDLHNLLGVNMVQKNAI